MVAKHDWCRQELRSCSTLCLYARVWSFEENIRLKILQRASAFKVFWHSSFSKFIEFALRHGHVNLLHIFRKPFPKNTAGGLLLSVYFEYVGKVGGVLGYCQSIPSFLRIGTYLLKKSLKENFIQCAVWINTR